MRGNNRIFSDQTGTFPKISTKGSKYIMVMYGAEINTTLAEPIKSRSEQELIRATTKMHEYLTTRGLKSSFQILDNKCPKLMKK